MRCGQVSPLDLSAMRPMAKTGRSAISVTRSAAADQPKLLPSVSSASRPRAGALVSAPVREAVPASLAPVDHQRRDHLLRQALIGLVQSVGEGIGGVDHRLDQI